MRIRSGRRILRSMVPPNWIFWPDGSTSSVVARACAENDCVVLSIFVNPTQFNDPADLEKYPRTLEADLMLAADLIDHVIVPAAAEIYPDNYTYRVTEDFLSRRMEGAHRPGHFDGVLTVVLKLMHLTRPDVALFGRKDAQQLAAVRRMVRDLEGRVRWRRWRRSGV